MKLLPFAVVVALVAAAPLPAQQAAPAFDFHGLSLGMTRVAFDKVVRRPGRPLACSPGSTNGVLACRAENVRFWGDTTTFSEVDGWFENATGRAIMMMAGRETAPRAYFDELKRVWDGRFGPSACREQDGMRQCAWSQGSMELKLSQGAESDGSGTVVSIGDREAADRLGRPAGPRR